MQIYYTSRRISGLDLNMINFSLSSHTHTLRSSNLDSTNRVKPNGNTVCFDYTQEMNIYARK